MLGVTLALAHFFLFYTMYNLRVHVQGRLTGARVVLYLLSPRVTLPAL